MACSKNTWISARLALQVQQTIDVYRKEIGIQEFSESITSIALRSRADDNFSLDSDAISFSGCDSPTS